jgi:Cof subfamily protein (haloacid dehalogenase superfamily)
MKIDLVAMDLDGTLLNSEKQITPTTAGIIQLAKQRGVRFMIVTARPPRTAIGYHLQLGLTTPMINYNGALAWDTVSGKVLVHRPIPANIARGIVKWARQRYPQIRVSAEVGDKWYTDFYDSKYRDGSYKTNKKVHQPDHVGPVLEWLRMPVTKLLLLGQPEWLDQVVWAIETDIPNEVTTVKTESFLLQVMHASASKTEAIRISAESMGIKRENIMAIGDNANDAGMVHWAGCGVAMANGHHVTIRVADHVSDHNDADGVGKAINDLILNGQRPNGR